MGLSWQATSNAASAMITMMVVRITFSLTPNDIRIAKISSDARTDVSSCQFMARSGKF
jgi:hypothetical protein